MKQSPDMDRFQRQMYPGEICRSGFLGNDTRKLTDILIEDNEEVKRLGITHAQIAARMRELRDLGKKGLELPVPVAPHFEVQVESIRGKLPCPFLHKGLFPKTNTTVNNLATKRTIIFTDLNIHMIEEHGFYEGKGACFRLEPSILIELFQGMIFQ